MEKIVCNEHTEFYYDSLDELIKDIQRLHKDGFIVMYGEEIASNRWMIYSKNIHNDEELQGLKGSYFLIYDRNENNVFEGYNNYTYISDGKEKNKINFSELDKEELKKYCYDTEHDVSKRNVGLAEAMDRNELKNLIELALIFKDKEWFKELSAQLNKKLHKS